MKVNLAAAPAELKPFARWARIPTVELVYGDVVPTITTSYMHIALSDRNKVWGFSPIGGFLSKLTMRLAWEDERLRDLAWYFYRAHLEGGEGSGIGREWAAEAVFSAMVFNQLYEQERNPYGPRTILWDYWSRGWG
jgi:hypothetical protein